MPDNFNKKVGFCVMGLSIVAALFFIGSTSWYPKWSILEQIDFVTVDFFQCNESATRSTSADAFFCPLVRDILPFRHGHYTFSIGLKYLLLVLALTSLYGFGLYRAIWRAPAFLARRFKKL